MKALSLTQPWATAIAVGQKQFETRSWPTKFRGEVCIHAAKGYPKFAREFASEEAEFNDKTICTVDWENLPLGKIICVASLVGCYHAETLTPSRLESHWGDFSIGRFAFKLENVRVLKTPVPAVGHLGFWPVPHDLANEVAWELLKLEEIKFRKYALYAQA
ncbi:MAG: hypothetical protein WAK20_03555 [Candidatus Acidiferrum sp.]